MMRRKVAGSFSPGSVPSPRGPSPIPIPPCPGSRQPLPRTTPSRNPSPLLVPPSMCGPASSALPFPLLSEPCPTPGCAISPPLCPPRPPPAPHMPRHSAAHARRGVAEGGVATKCSREAPHSLASPAPSPQTILPPRLGRQKRQKEGGSGRVFFAFALPFLLIDSGGGAWKGALPSSPPPPPCPTHAPRSTPRASASLPAT